MLKKNTDGSSQKMLWVPLPWWTSQSMIITLDTPCFACRCRAAIAALFRRQNPIPSAPPAAGKFQPPQIVGVVNPENFPVVLVVRGDRHERIEKADALEMIVDRDQAVRGFRVCERGDVEQIVRMVDIRDLIHQHHGE